MRTASRHVGRPNAGLSRVYFMSQSWPKWRTRISDQLPLFKALVTNRLVVAWAASGVAPSQGLCDMRGDHDHA